MSKEQPKENKFVWQSGDITITKKGQPEDQQETEDQSEVEPKGKGSAPKGK